MIMTRLISALICFIMMGLPAMTVSLSDASGQAESIEAKEFTTVLQIDNDHIYEHMRQSYAQGYEPAIENGCAVIVLPLFCDSDDKPQSVRISAGLEAGGSAFVMKNYEQTVLLAPHTDSEGSEREIYLAIFRLQLSPERVNGSYPVRLQAEDYGIFTVYVNISDSIDPNAKEPEPTAAEAKEEPIVLQPKILVQCVSGGDVDAGDTAELHITLKNTSRRSALQNLTVTVSAPEHLTLEDAADTLYYERIKAGAEFEAVFRCKTDAVTPAGAYDLLLQYDFAYGKGMTGSGSGKARVTVRQPVKMEFPRVAIPAEAVVSDRLELHLQALNLGTTAASNVRAELTADGLLPEGTAFIGTVEGGTSAESVLYVQVSSKRGEEPYGETTGQIIFTYEDENGTDHTEAQEFSITLRSPFSERAPVREQAPSRAWVWIMAVIGSAIVAFSTVLYYRRKRGVS